MLELFMRENVYLLRKVYQNFLRFLEIMLNGHELIEFRNKNSCFKYSKNY